MPDFNLVDPPLPGGLQPFPREQAGACAECGGPVHIYEVDLSLAEDGSGRMVCGNCTRARQRAQGPDKRSIRRQHKWKHGHDPSDDEATPESGFQYVDIQPTETPKRDDRERVAQMGGPESGAYCFDCSARGRKVMTRMVMEYSPYAEFTGIKPSSNTIPTKKKAVLVACPECEAIAHWNPDMLQRERQKNLGRI